jgi:hypothetical protein
MSDRLSVDVERLQSFMRAVGRAAEEEGICYLVGGATAVLLGWRGSTIDVDIRLEPEQESVLRALDSVKRRLRINVELASPADFLPLPGDWRERSLSVGREGRLTFVHFDLYAQTLAKLERGHARDLADVHAMLDRGLVEPERLRSMYEEIEPELFRFPAIDRVRFRETLDGALAG